MTMGGSAGSAVQRVGGLIAGPAANRRASTISRLRRTTLCRLGALVLVALTFVPVAASSHFHTATDQHTPESCAVCMVNHHTPAASLSIQPVAGLVRTISALVVFFVSAPTYVWRPLRIGRAPPVPFAGCVV